jgi:hypothetical protein
MVDVVAMDDKPEFTGNLPLPTGNLNLVDLSASSSKDLPVSAAQEKRQQTASCMEEGLEHLFPGAEVTVGDAFRKGGGHWNYHVQLQFASRDAALNFTEVYDNVAEHGRPPSARFGKGPAIHLENLSNWSVEGTTFSIAGTAHIDLGNPNSKSIGGGGFRGMLKHVAYDGVKGHVLDLFGKDIDISHCSW